MPHVHPGPQPRKVVCTRDSYLVLQTIQTDAGPILAGSYANILKDYGNGTIKVNRRGRQGKAPRSALAAHITPPSIVTFVEIPEKHYGMDAQDSIDQDNYYLGGNADKRRFEIMRRKGCAKGIKIRPEKVPVLSP